ncbi:MAG: hypothetical protein DWH82_05940 [Planctomycetota bacterium]|nr:MAG: hypothetical protein DWH82_05940 [Planctomycetota bacterium]
MRKEIAEGNAIDSGGYETPALRVRKVRHWQSVLVMVPKNGCAPVGQNSSFPFCLHHAPRGIALGRPFFSSICWVR